MLWIHKSRPFWLVSDWASTSRLAKSTVQHKTQQIKTSNNQHEMPPPCSPAALPSPSMGRPEAPPTLCATTTKVPTQGIRHQVCALRGWLPCLGHRTETHWKSERQEGSWPYGQNLIKHTTTNRKLVIAVGGMLERGCAGGRACGEKSSHHLGDNGRMKNNINWITPRPKAAAD